MLGNILKFEHGNLHLHFASTCNDGAKDFSTAMLPLKKMPVKQSKDFAVLFLVETFHIWGI